MSQPFSRSGVGGALLVAVAVAALAVAQALGPQPASGQAASGGAKISLPASSPGVSVSGGKSIGGSGGPGFAGGMMAAGGGGAARAVLPGLTLAPLKAAGTGGWRVKTGAGLPLATPAVAHGKVYFGGGYGSHEFYAVDAVTGKLAWQVRTDDDGPTAAVVYEDDILFNTESCTLYCVSARTGKIRWKHWLGDPLMNQPAAADGRVYMAYPDKKGQHRLTCRDIRSGKQLWNRPINGDIISAPVVDSGLVYLTTMDGVVYGFDGRTGQRQWSREYRATSAPWVHGKEIYVSTREPGQAKPRAGRSSVMAAGAAGAAPQEVVSRISRTSGERLTVQARREAAYLTESYNLKQRKALEYKHQDATVGFSSAPAAAKLAQARGNIGLDRVASVWAFQGSRPCVYQGRLYTSQHDKLRCTDAKSGRFYWEADFTDYKRFEGGRALTPPAIAGDCVYVATATGQVFCLDAGTGKIRWHVEVGEGVSFQPAVMGGRIYLATDKGSLYNLDARNPKATGWAMWGGNASHNGWAR